MNTPSTLEVSARPLRPRGASSPAFLLAQIGAHAAARFAERLSAIDLAPAHAGILRLIDASEGLSQQDLCTQLGLLPSRLVTMIDELEQRGLVRRRDHPRDRRSYALHLTDKGREAMKMTGRLARDHQQELCAALSPKERDQLAGFLVRIADEQELRPGVHPGFLRTKPK